MQDNLIRKKTYYEPSKRLWHALTINEAELAEVIRQSKVRQLHLIQTAEGWTLHALLSARKEFIQLVSVKKEPRHYLSLDRLLDSVLRHGRLPPTTLTVKLHEFEQ